MNNIVSSLFKLIGKDRKRLYVAMFYKFPCSLS